MKNILVVFTGGTIGSIVSNHAINTNTEQSHQIIERFKAVYSNKKEICFKAIQPLQILSENLHSSDWKTLIQSIESEDLSQFDGIIVTHGTDTLSFTSSALSLYFNAIKIPLLLVSSNYPLDHPQANGLINFNCAINFIQQRSEVGVFVPYKNTSAIFTDIHLGSRLSSCLPLSSDFISIQNKVFLQFNGKSFHKEHSINLELQQPTPLKPHFSTRVLLIKPYPGLDYSQFSINGVDIILHDLYHSGTACVSPQWGDNYSLLQLIEKCRSLNIPLYAAPAIKEVNSYDSTNILIEAGAKMIWNISLESAYAKILLGYGNFNQPKKIEYFLQKNIASEYVV